MSELHVGDSLRSLYFTSLETGWLVAWQLSSVCVRVRVRVCVCIGTVGGYGGMTLST